MPSFLILWGNGVDKTSFKNGKLRKVKITIKKYFICCHPPYNPAMSDSISLLMLPAEIRCNIYSFLYLEHRIVNFLHPKLYNKETALHLSCQQLYRETLEFYYGKNTFSLHLDEHFVVSDCSCLVRHFDRVKLLRIETLTFFSESIDDVKSFRYGRKCRQNLEKYLEAILRASQGTCAPNLKTLVLAGGWLSKPRRLYRCFRGDSPDEKLEEFVQVFERLQIGVGQVVVELHEGRGLDQLWG